MSQKEIFDLNNSLPQTPNKANNPMFRSLYLPNSAKSETTPQVVKTFFLNKPLERYRRDISQMRPVSYQSPGKDILKRKFIIVEEKIIYGKPLTADQFNSLKRKINPEIVTYAIGKNTNAELRQSRVGRFTVQVKKEAQTKEGWCCCGGSSTISKSLVNKYE